MTSSKTILVDAPATTPDAALELMAHHLQLAAMYFEALEEGEATSKELWRLLQNDDRALCGARVWYPRMVAFYEEMKERD